MIFYNDEIHQVYFRGRHHVAAYLGSVLVWRENVRPMQGVEYLMAAAELGAAAVPASELGTAAALPSPRVRHAEMVPAAGNVMRVQEAQQLNASCGMEALPASLLEMHLPLVLDVQGQMAAADAAQLEGAETRALPVSCGMGSGGPTLAKGRLKVTKPALAATAASAPPVLGDMNAVLASAVLSGGAESAGALPAVLPGKMKAALAGGGSVVGASALLAALGVKLTASCRLELIDVGWEYPVQDGETLRVTQVYGALQESDGALTLDAPVSGKVVKEQDGIAWIIPDGTTKYFKSGSGWVIYADRNEVQYIVLENRNTHAVNVKMDGIANAYVSSEAAAADAHPRGHITVNGVTVATTDGVTVTEGIWIPMRMSWGDFKNWQPNTQKVIGIHGGSYLGEYASTPMYQEQADLLITAIHTTEGS